MINRRDEFKNVCKEFLSQQSLNDLRKYGRFIGVANPTKDKKKNVLIDEIIAVLIGEIKPQAPSPRGAPIKNDFIDPKLHEGIKEIRIAYSDVLAPVEVGWYKERVKHLREHPYMFRVEDPNARALELNGPPVIHIGQLETLNGVSVLLPLNCKDSSTKIVMSVEMIRSYDLREGDVVECRAEKRNNILVAVEVLSINGCQYDSLRRWQFDTAMACYPNEKLGFAEPSANSSLTSKILNWLIPVGKGQRGVVVAPPKSGKSSFLMELAKLASKNKNICVMTLLCNQAPEEIAYFRKVIGDDNLVYTTYEDEPERQVFVAEFILKRAKRYAECGRDVLLLVDSFNALSHVYNETEMSEGGKLLAGGLESKTVQYLKRFFGTARCLERGGSLTMIGAVSVNTGNPADDLLKAELASISNLEICLSEEMARRHIYPAIDLLQTRGKKISMITGTREAILADIVCGDYLSVFTMQDLLHLLLDVRDLDDLEARIFKQLKTKKK